MQHVLTSGAAIAANQFGPLAYVSINGRIDSERHEPIFAFQPSVIFPSEETLLPETSASIEYKMASCVDLVGKNQTSELYFADSPLVIGTPLKSRKEHDALLLLTNHCEDNFDQ